MNLLALFFASTLFFSSLAFADEKPAAPLSDTTEVGVTMVSGNSNAETYLGKEAIRYTIDSDSTELSGNYLQSRTSGIETSRVWKWSVRNEYALSDWWSLFAAYTEESDFYGGIVQRDSVDLGAKYHLIRTDLTQAFVEEGFRYQYSLFWNNLPGAAANASRTYFEITQKLDDRLSAKFWIEYIANFTSNQDYQLNTEPSLLVTLSKELTLKTAYSVRYHGLVPQGKTSYLDTIFTLSLIAQF